MVSDFDAEADRRLLVGIASKSADSLARLYDRYASVVYGLARRIVVTSEDAEEVVQDVFGQVWRDAGRYQAARASVAGWIVMLTRTRAIDRLRAKRARPDLGAGAGAPVEIATSVDDPNPEQLSISAQQVSRLRDALTTLPESLRAIVELAYFEGLTHSEIADRTQLPLGTVKTRLRSAMATLRGVLA
jgi:RNA polymerase sigma-70 factor (ECF subfamily)